MVHCSRCVAVASPFFAFLQPPEQGQGAACVLVGGVMYSIDEGVETAGVAAMYSHICHASYPRNVGRRHAENGTWWHCNAKA